MKTKPISPYERLMDSFTKFANDVEYRKRITMWVYPKNKLTELLDYYYAKTGLEA